MKTFFWRLHQKEVFMIFVGENLEAKIAQKNFSGKFGEIRAKSFLPQKFVCSYTYDEKVPLPPLLLFWKSRRGNRRVTSLGHQWWRRVFWEGPTFFKLCQIVLTYNTLFQGGDKFCRRRRPRSYGPGGKCPRHASILRRPCAYYSTRTLFTRCCKLQCVTAMNINYQRSPKTEQFMTAKIYGNALKHGVEHTQCYVSAVLKAARMSGRIGVDQKVCGCDGGHPGLTAIWNLLNYTRIENAHEVRKKIYVVIMWLLCVQWLRGEKIRACVSRYDNSSWNTN